MGGIIKWNPQANTAVYLGHSPNHVSKVCVALVLIS